MVCNKEGDNDSGCVARLGIFWRMERIIYGIISAASKGYRKRRSLVVCGGGVRAITCFAICGKKICEIKGY